MIWRPRRINAVSANVVYLATIWISLVITFHEAAHGVVAYSRNPGASAIDRFVRLRPYLEMIIHANLDGVHAVEFVIPAKGASSTTTYQHMVVAVPWICLALEADK
jgi:hypothetical protein